MDPLAVACLLVFVSSLVNAVFVLFFQPRNLLKSLWGLVSFIIGVIGINLFHMLSAADPGSAYIHSLALNAALIFVPGFFFHFTLLLTGRVDRYKLYISVYYIVTVLYAGVVLLHPADFIPSVGPVLSIKYYCRSGPLFYFLPVWLVLLVAHGLFLVLHSYRGATAVRRNQLKYFFVGCALGLIGAVSALLPAFGVAVYPWGIYLLPLCPTLIAYAILKHQLMDIHIVLRKSLIYTLVISAVLLAFFLFTLLTQRYLRNLLGLTSDWMSSAVVLSLVALAVIPIYRLAQNLIDRLFYKGSFPQIAQENSRLRDEMLAMERYKTFGVISKSLVNELREPLNRIKQRVGDDGYLQEQVRGIDETIRQLENYSQAAPVEHTHFNIIKVLDEVVTGIQQQVNSQRTAFFKYYQAEDVVKIVGSAGQMSSAFANIFDHCLQVLKHEQERGDIFVTVEYDRSHVSFSIRHSGKGLTKVEMDKLFTPFFRGARFTCGLYLIVTQSIVVQHGGKIWVESEEDSGTEFLIELPL